MLEILRIKSRFLGNSFTLLLGTILSGFFGYLLNFILARRLAIGQYGEYQSLSSLFVILTIFGSGINYFTIKYTAVFAKNQDRSASRQFIFWISKHLKYWVLFLVAGFFALSPLIYNSLKLSSIWGLIFIGVGGYFSLLSFVYFGLLNGWQNFKQVSWLSIFSALVKLVACVFAVIVFPTAVAASSCFIFCCLAMWWLGRRLSKREILGDVEEIAESNWQEKYFSKIDIKQDILPTVIFSSLILLISSIDVLLVKYFTTSELTGFYSAMSILGKIVLWVNSAIIFSVLPEVCADDHCASQSSGLRRKVYLATLFVGLVSSLFYYLFPSLIISLLFGSSYSIFKGELWLFGLVFSILSLLLIEANLAFAKSHFKISYILGAVVFLLIVGISFFHQNIREIILVMGSAVLLGYFMMLGLNFFKRG